MTLTVGAGMLLLIPGERLLKERARELGMWPHLKDEPQYPWTVWHEWTFALWRDLFRRAEQRDDEYLRYQGRVRLGLGLVVVGFGGAALMNLLT